MTDNQKRWLTWIMMTLVTLAIALFFGVQYPMPDQPADPIEPIALGAHFSNPIDIVGTSSASAPALTFEGDTDTGIFRSAANTLNIAAGGSEMMEIDSSAITFETDLDLDGPIDLDGIANEVQLSVAGYTTQTNDLVQLDGGLVDIGGGTYATADGENDLGIEGDLEANGALDINGTATFRAGIVNSLSQENTGSLPSVFSTAIATDTDGALWTIADGEIWLVHQVFCQITTNFDCTGDDCILHIGDGNDEDGLLDLDDGELQAADTEGTGAAAGWQGFMSTDTRGAYFTYANSFIYAPSGAAETIDIKIEDSSDNSDPTAGAGTCYVHYTRLQ